METPEISAEQKAEVAAEYKQQNLERRSKFSKKGKLLAGDPRTELERLSRRSMSH